MGRWTEGVCFFWKKKTHSFSTLEWSPLNSSETIIKVILWTTFLPFDLVYNIPLDGHAFGGNHQLITGVCEEDKEHFLI